MYGLCYGYNLISNKRMFILDGYHGNKNSISSNLFYTIHCIHYEKQSDTKRVFDICGNFSPILPPLSAIV